MQHRRHRRTVADRIEPRGAGAEFLSYFWFVLLPFVVGDDYFSEMSETELLKAFRENRSEAAFAQLVSRYAGLVYSVAKRRLANASLAEDITQLVFIRLAKTPPAVQSHAELAAWLQPKAPKIFGSLRRVAETKSASGSFVTELLS
jgi:Sigma-70 region 2